jgi:hypothetical protein
VIVFHETRLVAREKAESMESTKATMAQAMGKRAVRRIATVIRVLLERVVVQTVSEQCTSNGRTTPNKQA